ncbi:MAG: DUF433 domain-containing protein [Balneolaceae bacterium]|nr:DUF433 domain-containing protein [Balneolaceae bacterium]
MSEQLLHRITKNPEICHGKPTIRGLRYPVDSMLELMASGMSHEEILEDYPDLEKEDLLACLEYAARVTQTKKAQKIAP